MTTQRYWVVNTPQGLKSISLENMSPDAFRTIVGNGYGSSSSGNVVSYYRSVPWFRRGVDVIVGAVEALPVAFMRNDEEVDPAEIGIVTDFKDLFARWALWFVLFGAVYGAVEQNRLRTRVNIRAWHPKGITPLYAADGDVRAFKRSVDGKTETWPVDEVIYVWELSADAENAPGVSRAHAALAAAGLLSSADMFATALFDNGAISPTLIEVPLGTPTADKERIESAFNRLLSGVKNAFKLRVIEGGDKLSGIGETRTIQLGSPPKDLVLPELTQAKREDISTALGVPQSILFSNAVSGSANQQDKLNLYDETVIPLFHRFARPLNERLFKPMGVEMIEQHGQMEIYQRQETAKAYGLAQLWTTNAVTREYLHDMMEMPEMFKVGTYYADIIKAAQTDSDPDTSPSASNISGKPLAKPPDLPNVPTIDAPEGDDMKADLTRWQMVALKRIREGKPDKALGFESASIPPSLAGAIRGRLRNLTDSDRVSSVFEQALAWESYP